MPQVLTAGLHPDIAVWLGDHLGDNALYAVRTGGEAAELIDRGPWSLIVLDHGLHAPSALEILNHVRGRHAPDEAPVLYCMEPGWNTDLAKRLIGLGVRQLLIQPLDGDELLRQVWDLLGVTPSPRADSLDSKLRLRAAMDRLWEQNRQSIMTRFDVIQEATVDILGGELGEQRKRDMVGEAHKLAGTLGTYGFAQGSYLARELELLIRPADKLNEQEVTYAAYLVKALREELRTGQTERSHPIGPATVPQLLVVDAPPVAARQISMEAIAHGMQCRSVAGAAEALKVIDRDSPEVLLLDLSTENLQDCLGLMSDLQGREQTLPVLVMTEASSLTDRVEIARRGGRGFLQKPVSAIAVMQAIDAMLAEQRATSAKVMVVDDDPVVLSTLRELLELEGFEVVTVEGPLAFWEALLESEPDILVLDIEMPHISGVELCRVVRNDPRWEELPILFLSVHTDPDSIQRVFDAKADDFVGKPIVGPELITRITNRIERARSARKHSEHDSLTGAASPLITADLLERLVQRSDSRAQRFCLAVLEVDGLKKLNDIHGHPTAPRVVARLGQLLGESFQGDDVVGRWSGDQFVLGMWAMTRRDGAERVADVLEALRQERFGDCHGAQVCVTMSAGVAEYPTDGSDVDALYLAANKALLSAQGSGGNRVVPCGTAGHNLHQSVDVLLLASGTGLAEQASEALETRGYVVRSVQGRPEDLRKLAARSADLSARVILLDDDLSLLMGSGDVSRPQSDLPGRSRLVRFTDACNKTGGAAEGVDTGAPGDGEIAAGLEALLRRVRLAIDS